MMWAARGHRGLRDLLGLTVDQDQPDNLDQVVLEDNPDQQDLMAESDQQDHRDRLVL